MIGFQLFSSGLTMPTDTHRSASTWIFASKECWGSLSFCTSSKVRYVFFSSSMADVALWLGPYMSISSKTSLYKDPKGPTMQANHNKPKTTLNSRTTRKSPSQICVSPRGKANQTHKRGQSPNENNHKKDLPQDAAVWPLRHAQKNAKNELSTTTFSETWKSKHRACLR